jgi:nicotinamidase-related amidase
VVGVDAEYCVYQTAKGALNRGYKVMVVKDAIGLLREDKWGKILNKYKDNGISVIESSVF